MPRTAIVTGSTIGIGEGIARALAPRRATTSSSTASAMRRAIEKLRARPSRPSTR